LVTVPEHSPFLVTMTKFGYNDKNQPSDEMVVRVRYIPERVMNVVHMNALSYEVTQELNAYAASVPSSPANQSNETRNESPSKLRPSNKP
jgi:hypothetical protein